MVLRKMVLVLVISRVESVVMMRRTRIVLTRVFWRWWWQFCRDAKSTEEIKNLLKEFITNHFPSVEPEVKMSSSFHPCIPDSIPTGPHNSLPQHLIPGCSGGVLYLHQHTWLEPSDWHTARRPQCGLCCWLLRYQWRMYPCMSSVFSRTQPGTGFKLGPVTGRMLADLAQVS